MSYRFDPAARARSIESSSRASAARPSCGSRSPAPAGASSAEPVDDGVRVRVAFEDGPCALLVWGGAGGDAAAAAPAAERASTLDGPWEVQVEATLEDDWGDLDAPEGAVETWELEHRFDAAPQWTPVHATFGPRARWAGPAPEDDLPAPLADMPDSRPAAWSPSRGIHKDPLHIAYLGPSGRVPEEFLDFGPVAAGEAVHLRAVIHVDAALSTFLAVGASAAKRAWLDGRPVALEGSGYLAAGAVELPAGESVLDLRLRAGEAVGALRAHFAFVADLDGYARPEWMRAAGERRQELGRGVQHPRVAAGGAHRRRGARRRQRAVPGARRRGRGRPPGRLRSLRRARRGPPAALRPGRAPARRRARAAARAARARPQPAGRAARRAGSRRRRGPSRCARARTGPLRATAPSGRSTSASTSAAIRRATTPGGGRIRCRGRVAGARSRQRGRGRARAGHRGPRRRAPATAADGASGRDRDPRPARARVPRDGEVGGRASAPGRRRRSSTGEAERARSSSTPRPDSPAARSSPVRWRSRSARARWSSSTGRTRGCPTTAAPSATAGGSDRRRGGAVLLDLGEVRGTAEVLVDGESAGVRVCSPYTFDLSGRIGADGATLEILVLNTLGPAPRRRQPDAVRVPRAAAVRPVRARRMSSKRLMTRRRGLARDVEVERPGGHGVLPRRRLDRRARRRAGAVAGGARHGELGRRAARRGRPERRRGGARRVHRGPPRRPARPQADLPVRPAALRRRRPLHRLRGQRADAVRAGR